MATAVEMPKLGNTVEDCLLAAWRKHKGDTVAAGDIIAEIETDKTNFDLTAPVDGVLLETFFEEGALVPVFTVICAIGSAGESVDEFLPKPYLPSPRALDRHDLAQKPESARTPDDTQMPDGAQTLKGAGSLSSPVPEGQGLTPTTALEPDKGGPPPERTRLSPRARRFSREHDFYPRSVEGTGAGGRILEADLLRVLHSSPRLGAGARVLAENELAGKTIGSEVGGRVRSIDQNAPGAPISSVRQRIAKRLRESLNSTAQYTLHGSANAGGLLAVRKKLRDLVTTADININDLVVFCVVRALLEAPDLNAELIDGVLYKHAAVHIGFACDTDRGLIVPVVRDAQDLSILGLARRMKQLAAQAVEGSIAVDDLSGGTFTVSNLGSLGVESFTPVLNPPQVAILGVNAIGLKLVRKPDGNIELIDSIGLSLTLDHQVVDGAPGARFLNVLRDKIEGAESLCTI
jgi:pyruvate dehydrogenase E2 component (dihydrolipoamide acetyltransferase)